MENTSRKPYIYKVTNLETGQYYIGSQCSGKTVGVNYFTSSTNKVFWDDFKNYREEKYKIEIIKEFVDPKECGRAENYVIRNYMLKKDGLCLNKFYCCSGKKVFSTAGTHPSEETRKKLSEIKKGIPLSEDIRKKISITLQGRPSPNKGLPAWNKGVPWSEEVRQKMRKTKKGHPSPRRIKISIEGNTFNSLTEASKYYNVYKTTISYWVKKNQHNAKKT